MEPIGYVALLILNIFAFCVCGFDKNAAKNKRRRVPEKTLFLISAVGGSLGMLLGMKNFRHKTKKPAFYIGIPAILVLQLAAAVYLYFKGGF